MNRSLIIVAVFALGAIGLVGGIIVHLLNPEAQATWGNFVFTLIGLMVSAAVTLGGLKIVGDKVDEVQKQTNGRLSEKDAEIERLQQIALDAGADPQTITGTTDTQA